MKSNEESSAIGVASPTPANPHHGNAFRFRWSKAMDATPNRPEAPAVVLRRVPRRQGGASDPCITVRPSRRGGPPPPT